MIRKIVIPAAGLGSRLLPITKEIPKEMLPIFLKSKSNEIIVKPLIQALVEKFFKLGIKEYGIIVAPMITNTKQILKKFIKKNNE